MNISYDKKLESYCISFIRVFAMVLIFLCHLVQESNNGVIVQTAQIFNVGVFIFLFISGYLYGQKNIENIKKWYMRRGIRILIPLYIFIILLCLITTLFCDKEIEIKKIFIYMLNLQGFLGGIHGAEHLWFLSILMVCYLVTPILNRYKKKLMQNKRLVIVIIVISNLIITYNLSSFIGLQISYILTYILGYTISCSWSRKIRLRKLIIFDLITLIILAIRFLSRRYCDGSILYDYVIVIYEQIIFGIAIFMNIYYLFIQINNKMKVKENKFIRHMDKISFYFYIVHYMYLIGPVRVMGITNSFVINSVIAIIISYLSSNVLIKICGCITKLNVFKKI